VCFAFFILFLFVLFKNEFFGVAYCFVEYSAVIVVNGVDLVSAAGIAYAV